MDIDLGDYVRLDGCSQSGRWSVVTCLLHSWNWCVGFVVTPGTFVSIRSRCVCVVLPTCLFGASSVSFVFRCLCEYCGCCRDDSPRSRAWHRRLRKRRLFSLLCSPSGAIEITVTSIAVVLFPRAVGLQSIR